MNIRPLAFLDVSAFTATLLTRHRRQLDEDGELVLRGDDPETGDVADRAILKDWKSARALIARLRAAAAPYFDGKPVTFGRIRVEKLGVGEATPWRTEDGEYAETHARLRICLVPSPGAMTYSGGDGVSLAVGVVNLVDHRVLHSDMNAGPCPRLCLVVDVRRPDAP